MHDLLRAYAAERANEEESGQAKEESLTRLFDYYAGTTAAAMDTLFPAGESRAASAPKPSTPMPEVADADTARNWLAANLVTIVDDRRLHRRHRLGWPHDQPGQRDLQVP